jgi:hypothetical protein
MVASRNHGFKQTNAAQELRQLPPGYFSSAMGYKDGPIRASFF